LTIHPPTARVLLLPRPTWAMFGRVAETTFCVNSDGLSLGALVCSSVRTLMPCPLCFQVNHSIAISILCFNRLYFACCNKLHNEFECRCRWVHSSCLLLAFLA
jgi:hypothetical protein